MLLLRIGVERMNRWRLEDVNGSVTTLCDITMMNTCNTFAQTHRMYTEHQK